MKRLTNVSYVFAAILLLAVDAGAAGLWVVDGIPATSASGVTQSTAVVPDGAGGCIVVYQQDDSGDLNLYAQRLNRDGQLLWGASGLPVCTAAGEQDFNAIIPDGNGGAIIGWKDYRSVPIASQAGRAPHVSRGAAAWLAVGTRPDGVVSVPAPSAFYSPPVVVRRIVPRSPTIVSILGPVQE